MRKILVSILFAVAFVGHALRQRLWPAMVDIEPPVTTIPSLNTNSVQSRPNMNENVNAAPLVPEPVVTTPSVRYQDGQYTGPVTDAFYGLMQVKATVRNGRLVDVDFLQYPQHHNNSRQINEAAMPLLRSAAVSAQGANIDIVSGATESSIAFRQSLAAALEEAGS